MNEFLRLNKRYEELENVFICNFYDESYANGIDGDKLLIKQFVDVHLRKNERKLKRQTKLEDIKYIEEIILLAEDLIDPANYPGYELFQYVTGRAYEDDNEARLWLKSFIEEMKRLLNEFLENHWDPEKGYKP